MSEDANLLDEALNCLKSGGFTVGADWHRAHEIVQAREGVAEFDWIHALCHRIEGDEWNAGYWYRRAGRERGKGAIEDEWAAMREALASGK